MPDTRRGYVIVYRRGHPLARGKDHRISRHRQVFYDAHAPAHAWSTPTLVTFPCRWCGYVLPFQTTYDPTRRHLGSINVDHLNEIPGDDRVENLAASCGWCNSNRGWAERRAPELWAQLQYDYGNVHPAQRPNPLHLIAAELGFDPAALRQTSAP